jgi:5-methylcytosine-specific restriction endonuclease McrA
MTHSEATRRKIGDALRGRPKSIAHREALSRVKKELFAQGKIKTNLPDYKGTKQSPLLIAKRSAAMMGKNSGAKNGQWRGGSWRMRYGINITAYRKFRKAVLQRDEHECSMCLSKKRLQVHHIVMVHEDPSRILDVTNAITLCKRCHIQVHSTHARQNPVYLIEYVLEAMDRMEAAR